MIIHKKGAQLLLIAQPDHAALAARIMRRWQEDELLRSPRRDEILYAVEHHDDGWIDVDVAPLVDDAGALLDFVSAPPSVRRGIWPRGVGRLAHAPYAAALVAQHAIHVYRRYRDDAAWRPFFDEMETLRNDYLSAGAPRTLDELLRDYRWVRTGDILSLAFCNGWTDVQHDERGGSARLTEDRLVLSPDPFRGATVPLEIPARVMPAMPFASAQDARAAYERAPAATLAGIAAGA